MNRKVAIDEPRSAGRTAPFTRPAHGGFDDFGMPRKIEIITSGEEQHFPAVDDHARTLNAFEHAHATIGAALAKFREHLIREAVEH